MRTAALAAALALLLALAAAAQDNDEGATIQGDRSSITTSTNIVPGGAWQLELGFNYGHERIGGRPTQTKFGLEAAVRVGLTDDFEVGFVSEPFVRLRGDVDDTNHGDFTLTAKWRFLKPSDGSWWPELALNPTLTLPVSKEPFGFDKTSGGVLLLASFALPGKLSVDFNGGMLALGQERPSGYLLQAFVGAGVSRDFAEGFTLFTDVVYTSRSERDGRDTVLLDGGVSYLATRNMALDASVVTSLAGQAPDWTVRAGVSVRFGK